jgi:hypothetical protein
MPTEGSTQSLTTYWPFALMVVGLIAAGAIVWFRQARPQD